MPQYTSQANIPSEVLALAPDIIQHQESGLDEVGEKMLDLSAKLQAAKEATQESKAIAQYNEGMAEVEQAIAGTDPRDMDVNWVNITKEKLRAARARALEGTSKRVRKSLSDKFIIDDQINVAKIAKRSINESGRLTRIEMPDQIQLFAAQQDRDGFIEYLRGKEDDEQSTGVSGVLTEPEVEHAIATYDKVAENLLKENQSNQAVQHAMGVAEEEGLDAATDALKQLRDDGTIEVDVYENARARLVREHTFNQAAENEAQEEAYNESVERTFDEKIVANDYTNLKEFVDALPGFTGAQRISLLATLENRAVAVNSGRKDPYLQYDSSKYFEFTQRLEADPTSVPAKDLFEAVGKGLDGGITVAQWKEFTALAKVDPSAEHNKTVSKEGIEMIDDMLQSSLSIYRKSLGTDESEDLVEIWKRRDAASQMKSEYRRWMQDAKDKKVTLTDQDHRTKINSLIRPEEEEIVLSLMESFASMGSLGSPSIRGEIISSNSIKRLEETGIWNELDDDAKTLAKKLLKDGESVESITAGYYEGKTSIGIKAAEQGIVKLQSRGIWQTLTAVQKSKVQRAFVRGKTIEQIIEAIKIEAKKDEE